MVNRVATYLAVGVALLACNRQATFIPPPDTYRESQVLIKGIPGQQTIADVDSTFFGRNRPELGRTYIAQEFSADGQPVAILSHAFWSEHFASRPGIIGSELEVDGIVRRIIGIMPQGVDVPPGVALWIPRK